MSEREFFRPAVPPYPAQDPRAQNAIVLVLGHWVDAHGRELAVQVVGASQRRRLFNVAPLPPLPAFAPAEDRNP